MSTIFHHLIRPGAESHHLGSNFTRLIANDYSIYDFPAGLYWNGRYPIDEAKGGLQITTGDVIHVLLPSFILPGKKPVPVCPADYCFNGGICYVEDYELKCDCRLTGWQGSRCEKRKLMIKLGSQTPTVP